jgi:hypothetical protein
VLYINYHSIIIVIMIIINFLFKIIVILLCNGDFILKLLEISLFFFLNLLTKFKLGLKLIFIFTIIMLIFSFLFS